MDPTEAHISMPRKDGKVYGLLDRRFAKMNTKQVFDILKQEKEEGGGGGDDDDDGGGNFDGHDWDGAKDIPEEQKKELERDIDQGLRQGLIAAKRAGVGAGDMDRLVGDMLAPTVDWREALREFVASICSAKDASSWRRVNRRFLSSDIYMPTLVGERVGKIVVAIDTSGSINGDVITRFLSEVKAIADTVHPEKIDLLYWDRVVAGHEEYDDGNMSTLTESTKPRGGGGTDPRSVMNYINNRNMQPECVVILTDGEIGDWGTEWSAPVLWVVKNTRTIIAPMGKSIHIEE
jgi:predicted metal-dependent peptidase